MFTNLSELPIEERALELERRVQKGSAYLDEVDPTWYRPERIDLARLRLANACDCVLGQIVVARPAGFGSASGWERSVDCNPYYEPDLPLAMSVDEAVARAFHLELTVIGDSRWEFWDILTDLWKDEILWRRG